MVSTGDAITYSTDSRRPTTASPVCAFHTLAAIECMGISHSVAASRLLFLRSSTSRTRRATTAAPVSIDGVSIRHVSGGRPQEIANRASCATSASRMPVRSAPLGAMPNPPGAATFLMMSGASTSGPLGSRPDSRDHGCPRERIADHEYSVLSRLTCSELFSRSSPPKPVGSYPAGASSLHSTTIGGVPYPCSSSDSSSISSFTHCSP